MTLLSRRVRRRVLRAQENLRRKSVEVVTEWPVLRAKGMKTLGAVAAERQRLLSIDDGDHRLELMALDQIENEVRTALDEGEAAISRTLDALKP